jgi:hypothetical protein
MVASPDDTAEQEEPTDIDIYRYGRDLGPDDRENTEDGHYHALG